MNELALLHNYLIVGALLFGIGLVGFLSRRNMIVMFLSAEMMLQGVSLSLVAWGRFHNDFGGQMLVIFIITVAACEAAIALALVLMLFHRAGKLDIAVWQQLREANQPPFVDQRAARGRARDDRTGRTLPPAGVEPEVPEEETDAPHACLNDRMTTLHADRSIPALPLAAALVDRRAGQARAARAEPPAGGRGAGRLVPVASLCCCVQVSDESHGAGRSRSSRRRPMQIGCEHDRHALDLGQRCDDAYRTAGSARRRRLPAAAPCRRRLSRSTSRCGPIR